MNRTLYLEYVNNWLTVHAFAEHYGMTDLEALNVINRGRIDHEKSVTWANTPKPASWYDENCQYITYIDTPQ